MWLKLCSLRCLLAALGDRMIDEDYQVFLSDGQALDQLWVLDSEDPPAGGKQKTLIVCIAPRFKLLLEEKCGTLRIVTGKFVRPYFMEHLSTINNQQAAFPLINHLGLLCMPRGVWENIWHSKLRPFLLSMPLSAVYVVHNSFCCGLAFSIYLMSIRWIMKKACCWSSKKE